MRMTQQSEAGLIETLAAAFHTEAMMFVGYGAATIHTSLDPEDHDMIVLAARTMDNGFWRLVRRDGIELGELVQVSDDEAITVLVNAGMIERQTRH
jgi:hypothetical protein